MDFGQVVSPACQCPAWGFTPPPMSTLKILVTGCRGRMGQAVAACADADPEVTAERQIDADDDLASNLAACDAVVDFSFHGFTAELVDACVAQNGRGYFRPGEDSLASEPIGKLDLPGFAGFGGDRCAVSCGHAIFIGVFVSSYW